MSEELILVLFCLVAGALSLCVRVLGGELVSQVLCRVNPLRDANIAMPSWREIGWHIAAVPAAIALVACSQTNTTGMPWLEFVHIGIGVLAVLATLSPAFMSVVRGQWALSESAQFALEASPLVFFLSLVATSGLVGGLLLVLPGEVVQVEVKTVELGHELGPEMSCRNEVTYTFVEPVTRRRVNMCSQYVAGSSDSASLELTEKVTWLGTRQIALRTAPP